MLFLRVLELATSIMVAFLKAYLHLIKSGDFKCILLSFVFYVNATFCQFVANQGALPIADSRLP